MVQVALDTDGEINTSKLITEVADGSGKGICTVYNMGVCLNNADITPLLASIWFGFIAMM